MHCTACGYDLTAHKSGERCPECGLAVDASIRAECDRNSSWSRAKTAGFIAACFILFGAGGLSLFYIFGNAWFSPIGKVVLMMALAGILPSLAIGVAGAAVWDRCAWLWCTVFSWPAIGLGILALFHVQREGSGMLIWTGLGLSMLGAGIGGAIVGRRLKRRRTFRSNAKRANGLA